MARYTAPLDNAGQKCIHFCMLNGAEGREVLTTIPREMAQRLAPYLPAGLSLPNDTDGPARVQGEIKRMLLAQQFHPGQKVPLDEIAASLGLSRTPVREGLRRLEAEGLVRASHNRGFAVRRMSAEETANLFEARLCVEPHVAARAAEQPTNAFVEELSGLQEIYARVLSGSPNRRRLGILADRAFHLCIAERTGNPFLADLLANVFDRLLFTRPLEGFPVARMPQAVAEHAAILAAIRGRDPERARIAMRDNVERGGAAIIAYLRELETARIAI